VNASDQEALWVLRAQSDDREAIELLLRNVQPSLRRYLRGLVGPDDADDVLQEVLLLIYRNLTWLDAPELFRPWAFRIANRAGIRFLKKRRRWKTESDELVLANLPSEASRPPDEALYALPRLQAISPASGAVLILHFQEDLPLQDVADILELPLGTVKSRLAYGLAILRKEFRVDDAKQPSDRSSSCHKK
jgi:RNA polymerase sigma-70 factor, ECF subfamily